MPKRRGRGGEAGGCRDRPRLAPTGNGKRGTERASRGGGGVGAAAAAVTEGGHHTADWLRVLRRIAPQDGESRSLEVLESLRGSRCIWNTEKDVAIRVEEPVWVQTCIEGEPGPAQGHVPASVQGANRSAEPPGPRS